MARWLRFGIGCVVVVGVHVVVHPWGPRRRRSPPNMRVISASPCLRLAMAGGGVWAAQLGGRGWPARFSGRVSAARRGSAARFSGAVRSACRHGGLAGWARIVLARVFMTRLGRRGWACGSSCSRPNGWDLSWALVARFGPSSSAPSGRPAVGRMDQIGVLAFLRGGSGRAARPVGRPVVGSASGVANCRPVGPDMCTCACGAVRAEQFGCGRRRDGSVRVRMPVARFESSSSGCGPAARCLWRRPSAFGSVGQLAGMAPVGSPRWRR